jgi:hypothetical protein
MYTYVRAVAGGTLAGARAIVAGETQTAIHFNGAALDGGAGVIPSPHAPPHTHTHTTTTLFILYGE